jgi:hypothetical protein
LFGHSEVLKFGLFSPWTSDRPPPHFYAVTPRDFVSTIHTQFSNAPWGRHFSCQSHFHWTPTTSHDTILLLFHFYDERVTLVNAFVSVPSTRVTRTLVAKRLLPLP